MTETEIMQLFADAHAIVTGSHFVYNSGRHSSVYVNKDALYLHTDITRQLCEQMASHYDAEQVDVVVGPVMGGIILSQWVAVALNARRTSGETLAVYAEKEDTASGSRFEFRRGYDRYIQGKRILVVEDVLTTGGSARRVVELVRQHGGIVVGLSALCNRGDVQAQDVGDVPLRTLITLPLDTYTEEECPFCQQGIPVNTALGKGKAFLARKNLTSNV